MITFNHSFFYGSTALVALSLLIFRDYEITPSYTHHIQTPLDEWSARRRDLCTGQRTKLKPAIPEGEQPRTDALDLTATGIDFFNF